VILGKGLKNELNAIIVERNSESPVDAILKAFGDSRLRKSFNEIFATMP